MFGFSSNELRVTQCIFVYLLNVYKLLIWQVRNDFHFRDVSPGVTSIVAQVRTRVRFNLPPSFKRLSPVAESVIFIVNRPFA